jgi:hypothetical protein
VVLFNLSGSRLSNAFRRLALAIRMPSKEAWFGGGYEKRIPEIV